MWVRKRRARAVAVGVALMFVSALAAPSLAFAGYKDGRYGGDTLRQANEPVSFKVKKTKGKKGKKKLKVKSFKIADVVVVCEFTPFPGEPDRDDFITELIAPLPFGSGKVKKKNGSFELKKEFFPNPDERYVGKASGKLSKDGSAQGEFTVRTNGYGGYQGSTGTIDCKQTFPGIPGAEEWEASLIG